ncbi:sigma-54-dependent transcriptional regulator [Rheinheimera soli]|uniref:sigma-54-dependent transcriptional regulator n=1 Tax=Rheinheimera soli TaxID=443616 RepID=UPI001E427CBE|nr:sigma-54 dependent transcriptional regulator [Rheinheimera soli]
MSALIVVADDDEDICLALDLLLSSAGYSVLTVQQPQQLMQTCLQKPDLVLLDMNFRKDTTSGQEGLALLEQLNAAQIPVILMTAWASVELAVQGMLQGARHFIQKPWHNRQLLQLVKQQLEHQQLQQENQQLKQLLQPAEVPWIAVSPVMQQLEQLVQQVAATDANILILGENGTGKSQLAQRLHQLSHRQQGSFISVNMAAIPDTLFEAELFGHEKGAFTDAKQRRVGRFALAHQGTLFLDEVGCLPLHLQPKLLRVLESGAFEAVGASQSLHSNARIISATNADLTQMVQKGAFRQDLLYRLNTLVLQMPALRQRTADIPALAELAIAHFCQKYRKPLMTLTKDAIKQLQSYSWPGNVRELNHVIERAVLLSSGTMLDTSTLLMQGMAVTDQTAIQSLDLAAMEQQLIRKALTQTGNQLTEAAALLGITRHALARRLEKHQMQGA